MKYSVICTLLLLVGSCEDSVTFEQPQPINQPDLSSIPTKLQGSYFSKDDSTYLTITEVSIIDWADMVLNTLTDSLDDLEIDSSQIVSQTRERTILQDDQYKLDIKIRGDSAFVSLFYRDTIFEISQEHVLRRFKGHYFLNYEQPTDWKVRLLRMKGGKLSFSKVRKPEDIADLEQITEVEEIRSEDGKVKGYKLNPSKRELRKLMRKSFSETKVYKRTPRGAPIIQKKID